MATSVTETKTLTKIVCGWRHNLFALLMEAFKDENKYTSGDRESEKISDSGRTTENGIQHFSSFSKTVKNRKNE